MTNPQPAEEKLKAEKLGKVFPSTGKEKISALSDVSFSIKEGEFVSIVGPSGCGKSTLINIVAGFYKASEGAIILDGEEIDGISKNIGVVFQRYALFPWLTVLENVKFGLELKGFPENERESRAREYIAKVGLSGSEHEYPKSLSGGMQQRGAIATVLATSPKLLLMDEPFSALDTQTKGLMQEFLVSIWNEVKTTVLFVTHDIDEAIFLSDKVYVMSAKPGSIKTMVDIDLPRPRTTSTRLSEDFLKIKRYVSYVIRGESIKAAHVNIEQIHPHALRVGVHTWPGVGPLYLANEIGLFRKHGVEVELVSQEKEDERIGALENNEVDVLHLTADSAWLARARNLPIEEIFLVLNQSCGADALIARDHIATIKDLVGKRVAIEGDWITHFFLLYILNSVGLSGDDVQTVFMKASDVGAALIKGDVDAAVLYEPWLSHAKELSGAKTLASSESEDIIYDVLASTRNIEAKKLPQIAGLVRAWCDAVAYIHDHPGDAYKRMAVPLGISTDELIAELNKVKLMGLRENSILLGEGSRQGTLHDKLEIVRKIWTNSGSVKNEFPIGELVNATFLKSGEMPPGKP